MGLDAERIVTKVLKVAALPAVAMKFSEAIKDPLTSNQDLENIVSEDSALAAKVLMIANSALFNFPSKIDTISKAITIIGHKQLSELILSCSIVAMFKDIPQDVVDMEQFWRHSISVATAARILAASRHEQNIEKYFTAGLLHDIGKLIIFIEVPKYALEIINQGKEKNELMYKVEKEVLGFDHANIGALLLKKWKLPENIVSSVYYHHMPSVSSGDIIGPGIIHTADVITHALQFGSSGDYFVPEFNEKAWESLDLDVEILSSVIEQLNVQYNEAVKYILG
ncbi:MAG: HDOD domain-containing protein [Gammaproteobacteria bacterium]|nr:HDOD domain-containing protein [Gammaproteobacteria bacterium]